jgi:hypothetical protein
MARTNVNYEPTATQTNPVLVIMRRGTADAAEYIPEASQQRGGKHDATVTEHPQAHPYRR